MLFWGVPSEEQGTSCESHHYRVRSICAQFARASVVTHASASQRLSTHLQVCGITAKVFGAPFNENNDQTGQALHAIGSFDAWFFPQTDENEEPSIVSFPPSKARCDMEVTRAGEISFDYFKVYILMVLSSTLHVLAMEGFVTHGPGRYYAMKNEAFYYQSALHGPCLRGGYVREKYVRVFGADKVGIVSCQ